MKLRGLAEAEQNYERQRQADQFKISAAQRDQVLALATDFPQLWNDPATANRERKRMVRLLIEDITIRKGEQIELDVRFRGGTAKTLLLPKPLSFCESHGVCIKTISDWRQKGLIRAHAINDRAQFLFEHPRPNPPKTHIRTAHRKAA